MRLGEILSRQIEQRVMGGIRRRVTTGLAGHVLEIGCGSGPTFQHLPPAVTSVWAVDPDPDSCERARRHAESVGGHIRVRCASAEAIPFVDQEFDAVLSFCVLCSVADLGRALAEIRRVLKPGGEFRFFEHVRRPHPFGAFYQDLLTPIWKRAAGGCQPNRPLESELQRSGFMIAEIESLTPVPPIPPLNIVRHHVLGVARPA